MPIDRSLIDRKALTAACKNPHGWWEALPAADRLRWWAQERCSLDLLHRGRWYLPDYASVLYSLQAHLRGKLHAARKYNPSFRDIGGRVVDERTMRDQEALIGARWQFFLTPEAEAQRKVLDAILTPDYLN
jgi:hypothetical protein